MSLARYGSTSESAQLVVLSTGRQTSLLKMEKPAAYQQFFSVPGRRDQTIPVHHVITRVDPLSLAAHRVVDEIDVREYAQDKLADMGKGFGVGREVVGTGVETVQIGVGVDVARDFVVDA